MESLSVHKQLPLSVQLYSVRSLLKEDLSATLKGISDTGLKHVEWFGGYAGYEPKELVEYLNSINLSVSGKHLGSNDLLNPDSLPYKYARAFGNKFMILSLLLNPDNLTDMAKNLREINRVATGEGFQFCYHNHAHEFVKMPDGTILLDRLFEICPEISFQFDVFFCSFMGFDACEYLKRFKGRVPLVHFNDMLPEDQRDTGSTDGMDYSTELGTGIIDLHAIYKTACETGVEMIVLEQHKLRENPIDSVRSNVAYYNKILAVFSVS